ncbi:endoplasmic reticulum metallopeptidase 1-like [Bicyclus anynana]|uniref:Endoplasmic reticulum metallopeptidase 1-like n=1 Tax=Bicyclus anynana TaxID=110368 RepID=A0ABM3LY00_BICAN|nr:endoplasmic reticulum metallopeptidase 1-like [Bicyclus anynana]
MFMNKKKRDIRSMEGGPQAHRLDSTKLVKENDPETGVVSLGWLAAAAVATALTLLVAALADAHLPAPLDHSAPPQRFIAEIAYEHLVNLTSIGPRVAGSYENEVAAVRVLTAAARGVAAAASAHNRVDHDVFTAGGAFALGFLDGMSHVYRGVQSVVLRARGAGGRPGAARRALLLNCHFDTVPDSPGASDDAAGCAVGLEVLRALAAGPPLRHDVLLLLNGAEENVLQASHAFVTQHRWARAVRSFVNLEACGAGGREVLFQAGPHDPWLVELYAAAAPHPFASSLAQELFQSGLIPADTDFRIFRDFGNLSGVDLAWSSDGYVYHTRLDAAARVPRAALQRTGDNVLALARAALAGARLERPVEREPQPVFFDVLGVLVVSARAPAAAAALLLTLLAAGAELALSARDARRRLYMSARAWCGVVARAALGVLLAWLAGAAAALVPAALLHAAGARLAFYSRTALLLPLYALPALAGCWADARHTWGTWLGGGAARLARGWWAWRAWRDALCVWSAALAAAGAAGGLRSSFVPLLWLLPALGGLLGRRGRRGAALHAAAAALPALQCAYLALNSVQMFAPIMGRAGTTPLPPDVIMSLLVSSLTLLTFSWMLPLVVAAKNPKWLIYGGVALCAVTTALVLAGPLGAAYSAERPQRLMVFHARRTQHGQRQEHFYWVPELDANTPATVRDVLAPMLTASTEEANTAEECDSWPYCGAPYFLPVMSLVARGQRVRTDEPPAVRLNVTARLDDVTPQRVTLSLNMTGPAHVVLILAPAVGAHIPWCDLLDGAPQLGPLWGVRRTYFIALHNARVTPDFSWILNCHIVRGADAVEGAWVDVSAAGHAMAGEAQRTARHERLLRELPAWTAPTGWGVDLHLLRL